MYISRLHCRNEGSYSRKVVQSNAKIGLVNGEKMIPLKGTVRIGY